MTLNASKKYTFAGEVYEWVVADQGWTWGHFAWSWHQFQYFADKGLATEVKEPRRVECDIRVCGFNDSGHGYDVIQQYEQIREAFGGHEAVSGKTAYAVVVELR